MKWKSSYYFYVRLSFGCKSSPIIFDNLFTAVCYIAMNSQILFTLSIGRRASNLTISNTIPKYSKHVTGPTVLCAAI
jgi:hypothetical protein